MGGPSLASAGRARGRVRAWGSSYAFLAAAAAMQRRQRQRHLRRQRGDPIPAPHGVWPSISPSPARSTSCTSGVGARFLRHPLCASCHDARIGRCARCASLHIAGVCATSAASSWRRCVIEDVATLPSHWLYLQGAARSDSAAAAVAWCVILSCVNAFTAVASDGTRQMRFTGSCPPGAHCSL